MKAEIRARFRRGAMQGTLLTMFKLDRSALADTLAGLIDMNAGPLIRPGRRTREASD